MAHVYVRAIHPSSGSETGDQFNGVFGTSYQIDANKVIGLFGGYEGFNYTDATPAQLSGSGLSIGTFVSGTFNEKLKLDARAYTTFMNYTILNGATSGALTAQRVGLTTTASYELGSGPLSIAPFVSGSALFEWQSAYTDSVATAHAAQSLAQGILAPGVKLSRMIGMSNGSTLTPFISGEADFIFGNTTLSGFNGTQGISGQFSAGANWRSASGISLGLTGTYGGIGSTINSETAQAVLSIPLN